MRNTNMIYTPNDHIPIGEAVRRQDGSHALRIKNHRTSKFDEITIDALFEEVIKNSVTAEARDPQGIAAQQ